ncbi:GOLPH3/VPS74 family protein [Aeromicrobium sp. CF3.5]|uniref:GOLPH3/VPS74 family protein n=1 Tax=Aeromicrobium sp. CF3.5 TaxID=3373078 RepID=UPI003EE6150F
MIHPDDASAITANSPTPTLAEDLLLMLFQPQSGTIVDENTLFYSLAGAVLAELAMQGHVDIALKPRSVQTVLAATGPPLRAPVLQRLVERGDIQRVPHKTLFIFRTTALRGGANERRVQLLDQARRVLVDGEKPTARTAAVLALLSGSGTLPQLHHEIPWTSTVIARAKELENGNWGAGAAAEAVARTVTATVINNVVVAATVLPRTT